MKNIQDNNFNDNKLTNWEKVTVNRYPSSDNELANKKYVGHSLGDGINLRFDQTLQNYIKICIGNDVYNLTKYDGKQITDTTVIK